MYELDTVETKEQTRDGALRTYMLVRDGLRAKVYRRFYLGLLLYALYAFWPRKYKQGTEPYIVAC